MQAELLDSVVSPNSQELPNASSALKLFENPLFKIRVIMRLGDPWFVASDACKCLELKDDAGTICRELDEQDKVTLSREEFMGGVSNRGIICSVDSRVQSLVFVSESGLYDLIMQSRKPEAKAFKRWVTHEVLPSIRKTGGYGIRTVDDMINDPDTAIRLLTQLKILRLQNDQLEMERDEAIRTKAMIGSSREATAMNTASQKSKECAKLTAENAELKDAVGRGMNWHTVNMMTAEWKREFGHAPDWHQLKKFSADLPKDMQPIKDVEVKVVLRNGSERVSKLFRYHREAWAKYREYEENSRVTDKNVPNTKILDLEATDTEIEVF